jgi:hypothetical protein
MQMLRHWGLVGVLVAIWAFAARAQSAEDVVWVQIEAHPTLTTAQDRVRDFAAELEDVAGFTLPNGWYAIALGPYRETDAEQVLRVYRAEGVIPRDSYIEDSSAYSRQFWPLGANVLNRGVISPPGPAAETPAFGASETAGTDTAPLIDETPAEARRSEWALTIAEREKLQIALQWAGYYTAAIDGAFGRGTRGAMAAWQDANGYDATGILTTAQRAALIAQYNAVLQGLEMQPVRDAKAGIEIAMPTAVVAFDRYEYPFAHYTSKGEIDAQVLLISQTGNQDTLFGLYDIMQTLEIVPLDGERMRRSSSFLLIGRNDKMVSHTEVSLDNGAVKGFTLIWPAGDEERRTRIIDEMKASFTRFDGALDPSWADNADQAVDLVAGLQIRRPRLSRSGFFVNDSGAVVTTLEAVQNCGRITLDEDGEARLAAADDKLGVAVLEPLNALAPRAVARFSAAPPRLQSDVAVAGFSYGGMLGAPTMTFGALADLRGLRGEPEVTRLTAHTLEGDAGGPVFDQAGGVLGMLLPREGSDRQLPPDVSFAAKGEVVQSLLSQSGIASRTHDSQAPMAPEDISAMARDMTVLVNCWD